MTVARWLWRHRRQRPWLVSLVSVTALVLLSYPVVDALLRATGVAPAFVFWDFGAYGAAVNRWLTGESIYVAENGDYHGGYLYPPVVLLLFAPFTLLAYPLPATLWGLLSVGVLWHGSLALVRAAGYEPARYETAVLGVALLGFQPLLLSVKLGQTAGFLGGVLCFAGAAALSSREDSDLADEEDSGAAARCRAAALSGALSAVAGLVKLPYAPASAHLLTDRRRLLGGVAAGIGLVALSLAGFGLEANAAYLDVLRWGATEGLGRRPPTLWLPPYYRPFYLVDGAVGDRVALALRVALAGGIAALAARQGGDDPATFALGVAAVPLLAPQTYTYYLVALVPAALALLPRELRESGMPWVPVLALLLAHLHAYGLKLLVDTLAELWLLALLQPGLWGNLLLVGLAGWRVSAE
jgi:hypothetical protein